MTPALVARLKSLPNEYAAISLRALEPRDLAAALALQAGAYPPFLREAEETFASRLTIARTYCLAASRGGTLVAYLLAHGWPGQAPPAVGTILPADAPSEVLFIHDLAVAPSERGSGLGRRLVTRALELAARDGLARAELIAVEGAARYWRSLGFAEAATSPDLAAKVAAYGLQARWMSRGMTSRCSGPQFRLPAGADSEE
jgi:predicted N-acetyltransferase YhbS